MYREAAELLREAIKDPKVKEKLAVAQKKPKDKKLLTALTQEDVPSRRT